MKPSDLFGIVVRTVGLLGAINGAWYLIYGFLLPSGALSSMNAEDPAPYFASGIPFLVGGCFLMRGADWFVSFAYPAPKTLDGDHDTDTTSVGVSTP